MDRARYLDSKQAAERYGEGKQVGLDGPKIQ